ncbi:hypothetical protein F5Y16DRAFT_364804 [Xylariaceae sp. FL0255]|nr:hypothetical protein F5Y16DRAFT_364804 [Xylariaceae sp. FL0255]
MSCPYPPGLEHDSVSQDPAHQRRVLGDQFYNRYQTTAVMEDLDTAILRYQEALGAMPEVHPDRSTILRSLENAYSYKYNETGAIKDLESAMQRGQELLDATPEGHPDHAARLESLGSKYGSKYLRTRSARDLNTAIQLVQDAIKKTPEPFPQPRRLESLAWLYKSQFEKTGAMAFLERAIDLREEVLKIASQSDPDYPYYLCNLACAYDRKYAKTGTLQYLDQSILLARASLSKTPMHDPERVERLDCLAHGYQSRFARLAATSDLDRAIRLWEEALKTTKENDRLWPLIRNSLINTYGERYRTLRDKTDTDRSLQLGMASLERTPDTHPNRASLLETIAGIYYDRFRIVKDIVDSEHSIRFYLEALKKTSDDPIDQVNGLQKLATVYRERFQVTGNTTDFERAIGFSQQAIEKMPEDHQERAFHLRSLADTYILDRSGAVTNSNEAIKYYTRALDKMSEDHTQQDFLLLSLSMAQMGKFIKTRAAHDLDQSAQTFHKVLNFPSSPIRNRIIAGGSLLRLYAMTRNWLQAYEAASQALSMVPLFAPRFLRTSDKQNVLASIVGLGSDAAAVALMAGKKPSEAIALLELGRGVIASARYDMPTVISLLREQHPQVAGEYTSLRDQLEFQDGETHQIDPRDLSDSTNCGDQRYNVSQKLEEKIQEIRKLPGFDRFLLGPDDDELEAAAAHGPIVIINVSRYRCDALIIETSLIRTVQLPRLLIKDIRGRAQTLASSQSLEPKVLEWLWETVAGPVLDALGLVESPRGDWPRIWWIPTGLLVKFPIHAAGRHSDQSLHTVLDRAISSYSASVRALVHSRQNRLAAAIPDEPGEPGKIVLVGMEKTPGQSTLRFVLQEIQELEKLWDFSQLRVIKPQPCRNDVLSAIKECKIFHFAGHGYSNPSDPSLSSLLLRDDSLTVASLIDTNLKSHRPFLAYLSACGTGQVKHNELLDEGLHLISACQLAGFQHVVGTLWEVNDESCVEAAIKTYEWMQKQHMSDESVSEALHRASRNLRDRWRSENAMRGSGASSKCITTGATICLKDGGQVLVEQSRSVQGKAREPRDVESYDDDLPLYWVPFVHFGI